MAHNPSPEKVALVTGGSRGIGRGIALALAREGWQVAFTYRRDAAAAEETARAIEAAGAPGLAIQADIASPADREMTVNRLLDAWGGVDLLVNNAGMAPRQRGDLLEMSEDSYDEVMATNLKGPFFLTQRVARVMVEQVRAAPGADADAALRPKIINISSVSAEASGVNRGEYCISKAGMGMMTALFADRLAADGILVYEIRPGIIETDMTGAVREKYDRLIAAGVFPLARWGRVEDVARLAAALAGGVLPYSTGEVIHVDGGFHLRRL